MDNIEWLEAAPLPQTCRECAETFCDDCDHAGERWYLSEADTLRLRRKRLLKIIHRLQNQVAELDEKIAQFNG